MFSSIIGKITQVSSVAKRIWSIVLFYLPILEGLLAVVELIKREEPDDGKDRDKEEREDIVKIIMIIYDTADEMIDPDEESIPVSREVFKKYVKDLISVVFHLREVVGNFSFRE